MDTPINSGAPASGTSPTEAQVQDTAPAARTLLLVDDEDNILTALRRLLRRDGYRILTANGGQAALDLLANEKVDVIVSDQRMPNMTGVDFLRRVKELYPETVRIVLSGYTELQSITDAINEGAIYKFLTKPWEDEPLRHHIREAFHVKVMGDDNRRLSGQLRTANRELEVINSQFNELLRYQELRISCANTSLSIAREAFHLLPVPVIGVDDEGMIALANPAATRMLGFDETILGSDAARTLPGEMLDLLDHAGEGARQIELNGRGLIVNCCRMGASSTSRGWLLSCLPMQCDEALINRASEPQPENH
ncbi:MAG: response regulator [Burkholderiales bacterium]|nr:response regulator [Burkholderiales bacterium]